MWDEGGAFTHGAVLAIGRRWHVDVGFFDQHDELSGGKNFGDFLGVFRAIASLKLDV